MDDQTQVFPVTAPSFQTDVVERSQRVPVLVLFWAEQDPPSAEVKRLLEVLVGRYQGKVLLGLVDVAQDQALAQQLRVKALPSIRVVQGGQLTDQREGPQTEAVLTEMLNQLTASSTELLREQLESAIANADYEAALAVLQQSINEEPRNQAFRVELADVLVLKGDFVDARRVLDDIPEETEALERPRARLEIAEESAALPSREELLAEQADKPEDLEIRYQLAIRECFERNYEASLDHAIAILQADREFREDIGRTTMLRIFNLLGAGSQLATRYRRKMFNYMH
ncbi:MAG: tetratricopeptide repeat protein [Gammaproteobacteria bacterium]|nr:tetratricopeptide repeat protein [Gammaproteobacteria bacterium]